MRQPESKKDERNKDERNEEVQEASEESFPASDAPSWSAGTDLPPPMGPVDVDDIKAPAPGPAPTEPKKR